MIVYQSTKEDFLKDASSGCIEDIIRESVKLKLNKNVGNNEYISWKNSLGSMYHIINNELIPNDSGIAIEYSIPRTKNRIDFIITGQDENNNDKVIIIELKQWTDIEITEKDAVVLTRFQQGLSEELHPSYQAWSYAALLFGFNATVYNENIGLQPCAYLHNHIDDNVVKNSFYSDYLQKAPVFCKGEKEKLQNFITRFIKHGDKTNIMYRIDNGEIRPSKNLADSMVSMIKGNQEFIMIDDQKIVYETALSLARKSSKSNKNVLIVEGGPGTGKSVVAINLLVQITKLGLNTQYVTKNAAPRAVFESKLTRTLKKTEISNMFTGSGSYIGCDSNTFDCLIVDEAHRLNEKSGMFKNLGENQIKEIIEASKSSIFFIDEDQKVTWHDIGKKEEIEKWANKIGAKVQNLKLESQFRCNGSDGYLSWLDNILGIEDTANTTLEGIDYDFKIVDSPNELRDLIFDKNKINNKARLVAGYCWNWISKKDKKLNDITIPEYNFGMKWNLASDGNIWIISPKSVNEIGCIHTCQGLEVDYVGVIVGNDFIVRNGEVVTNPSKRAKTDASLKGYKKELKENPEITTEKADAIIKNTYRTLMTRGMKGCYVYFTDKETEKFFKSRIRNIPSDIKTVVQKIISPYTKEMIGIPLVGSAPCGEPLLGESNIEEIIMVEKSKIKPGAKYFIVKAKGDSMDKVGINDGDLVLCRFSEKAETGDRVVALLGGENVTIKMYDKKDGLRILLPKSTNSIHQPIMPEEGDSVQGIVQEVIKKINEE
ncbi:MAG: DNA/RNA helicase domain-containing protein [Candidatus Paceibacterota bacterium]